MKLRALAAALLLACGPGESQTCDGPDSTSTPSSSTSTTTSASTATPATNPTSTCSEACDPDTDSETSANATPDLPPPGPQCDQFAQNCPPGLKCTPVIDRPGSFWNNHRCVPITGDQQPGEPCTFEPFPATGIDDCQKGAMCWERHDTFGKCDALCTGTADMPTCEPGFICWTTRNIILALCVQTCDPLLQDCPPTQSCVPGGDHFVCELDISGDEGQVNDPCFTSSECDTGLACLNPFDASSSCSQDLTGCCQPYCTLPDGPCPNPDQQCEPFFDPQFPVPPGSEDVGVCAAAP